MSKIEIIRKYKQKRNITNKYLLCSDEHYLVDEILALHDQVKKLTLSAVGCSLISEEEFNLMANDYIKLECHEYDGFDIKAKRFKDYRNGLKNMHETMKLLN